MKLDLNTEDIKMIKEEFDFCRCLYWDSKLKRNDKYCDGECYECNKQYTIDKWLEDKTNN